MKFDKRLGIPIYPFVCAIFPPINLYLNNTSIFRIQALNQVLMVNASIAFILLLVLSRRGKRLHTAAIQSSLVVAIFTLRDPGIIIVLVLVALCITMQLICRKKQVSREFTIFANIAALCAIASLFLFALWPEGSGGSTGKEYIPGDFLISELGDSKMQIRPDIYHFVLDGYSSDAVLLNIYGFDNRAFTDQLKLLGFRIFYRAVSPYNQTLPIMASIFAAEPLITSASNSNHSGNKLREFWKKSIVDSAVFTLLKNNDYQLSFVSETFGYDILPFSTTAEYDQSRSMHGRKIQFEQLYFKQLFLSPLFTIFSTAASVETLKNHNGNLKRLWSERFFKLQDRPRFYYSHAVSPHPPFSIDSAGELSMQYPNFHSIKDGSHAIQGKRELALKYKEGYLEKLQFTNTQIFPLVRNLVLGVPGDKIIIIHGDHGGGSMFDHNSVRKTCIRERFSPYYAIYSSQGAVLENADEREPFSIVNTYRMILSKLYSKALPVLPPRSFYISWESPGNATELSDITSHGCARAIAL